MPPPRARGRGGNQRQGKQQHASNFPNLHQLQRENRKKAKKHFKGIFGQTPLRSVPRAPDNTTSFLLNAPGSVLQTPGGIIFHAVTPNPFKPGTAWKNGYGTVDQEAAELGKLLGIDMSGSNAGLITKSESKTEHVDTEGEGGEGASDDDPFGFELHLGVEEGEGPVPASARARIDEQAAYIAHLEEQNMNLQERLFLAEQQAKELQVQLEAQQQGEQQGGAASSASEGVDHSPHSPIESCDAS